MIYLTTNITNQNLICLCWAIFLLSCSSTTKRNLAYEIHGIDVSRYQLDINWVEVLKDSIQFVFVKTTEGGDYQDPNYAQQWKALERLPVKRGAYHFFLPKTPVQDQIDNFYLHARLSAGDLPPVVDFERTQNLPAPQIESQLTFMLDGLEDKYGVKPIIYTNLKLYFGHIAGRFDEYPIWIARYSDRSPKLSSQYTWTFWQYSNRGRVKGIQGPVDLNVFRGSQKQLEALCLKEDPHNTGDAF
ncbi:UNVERIFIED_CONTAM: hypothetical protein GTU68_044895 [Idotea baltica]|nr:hypothetical protein [Idotea baltica]